ncbi:branched-chain amino acid ABC transporterATP-binding protein [Striga asiatica]|uniref:Branched-chain amino acid ABC transporterATP-binding protein n=1 Tax=Striga asiatica TaxID=4170 RepID=A0A5A7Q271_STRAF|nr:branched-chain amino acid ABC transporterATP-binding protein [Striga asiatica]
MSPSGASGSGSGSGGSFEDYLRKSDFFSVVARPSDSYTWRSILKGRGKEVIEFCDKLRITFYGAGGIDIIEGQKGSAYTTAKGGRSLPGTRKALEGQSDE